MAAALTTTTTPAFSFLARPPSLNGLEKNLHYSSPLSSSSTSTVRRRPRPLRHSYSHTVVSCTSGGGGNTGISSFPSQLVSQVLGFLRTWPPRAVPDAALQSQSSTILIDDINRSDGDISRMVADELRVLDATSAADLAFAILKGTQQSTIPVTWRETLLLLLDMRITGEFLDRLINKFGLLKLLSIDPTAARDTMALLTSNLYLSSSKLRRLILRNPSLLLKENHETIACNVEFFKTFRFQNHHMDLQDIAMRSSDILLGNTDNMKQVLRTLQTDAELRGCIKKLIVRAPFILLYDLNETVAPALRWLKREDFDVDKFIRSCPYVLGNNVESFEVIKLFLTDHVQTANYRAIIRSFPPILVAPVHQLETAVYFLRVELGIPLSDVSKIVQAFPTTLVLDVDGEMRVNVEYFRGKGIENICRIVKRLPPILNYDLQGNIVPKMNYLENTLRLSPYDVLSFPAYFSYNLQDRIQPRTLFLLANGKSVAEIGLNLAITCTDQQFCERIAKKPYADYRQFVQWLRQKRRENHNASNNGNSNSNQYNGKEANASKRPVVRPRIIREVKEEEKVFGS